MDSSSCTSTSSLSCMVMTLILQLFPSLHVNPPPLCPLLYFHKCTIRFRVQYCCSGGTVKDSNQRLRHCPLFAGVSVSEDSTVPFCVFPSTASWYCGNVSKLLHNKFLTCPKWNPLSKETSMTPLLRNCEELLADMLWFEVMVNMHILWVTIGLQSTNFKTMKTSRILRHFRLSEPEKEKTPKTRGERAGIARRLSRHFDCAAKYYGRPTPRIDRQLQNTTRSRTTR